LKDFVVAGVQISVKPDNIEYNINKIITWLNKAVDEHNAELIVFPESITTGFAPGCSPEELWDKIDYVPGKLTGPIAKAAKKNSVFVVLPTYERGEKRGVVYNSAVLIGPDGNIIGKYSKTHLFPSERLQGGGWTTPGNKVEVFETDLANIGITICYEGDFPELSRILAIKGAEVIVRPSALLRSYDIWEMTNKARAYDNHIYMIGVNSVGADAEENYYFGHSMIISPIAEKIALARGTEEIVSARLDSDPIKHVSYGVKSPMIFDHLEDRNLSVYDGLTKEAKSKFEPYERIPYKKDND